MAGVSNKGRITAGEFRSTEFTGWRSGWVVAVLDGDERPTRDGAGGGGGRRGEEGEESTLKTHFDSDMQASQAVQA